MQKKITLLVCDNPSCKMEQVVEPGKPTPGLHISGKWVSNTPRAAGTLPARSGKIDDVYACNPMCLALALDTLLPTGAFH